jgi:hypothetical protein
MATEACPRSSWTNFGCAFWTFWNRSDAQVWRRSWKVICGSPACFRSGAKDRWRRLDRLIGPQVFGGEDEPLVPVEVSQTAHVLDLACQVPSQNFPSLWRHAHGALAILGLGLVCTVFWPSSTLTGATGGFGAVQGNKMTWLDPRREENG